MDSGSLHSIVRSIKPDEVYNLCAQSHVRISFDMPEFTGDTVALEQRVFLEAVRQENPQTKFYQASSSEMFGKVQEIPQKKRLRSTPEVHMEWRKSTRIGSPSTIEKVTICLRVAAFFSIMNHRRGESFVTRKLQFPSLIFLQENKTSFILETWMLSEIGVMPRTMWKQCG